MYSVNAVPLDNDALGWVFLGTSEPLSNVVRRVTTLNTPGRHGSVPLPSTMESPKLTYAVETPRTNLESLLALWNMPNPKLSLTATPTKEVVFELLSSRYEGFGPADESVQVEFLVQLNGVFWRDATETTTASVTIASSPQVISAFAGISGDIQDSQIKIKGAFTGLIITDSAGSWISYTGTVTAAQWIRINTATGEAFLTTTDVWTGGTDVSGNIDTGGAVGGFRITPKMVVAPTNRQGELTITTATRSAAAIQVRGKGAYIV